jgi:hypothetical protein
MIGFLNHDISSCDAVDVNQGIQLPAPSVKLRGPGPQWQLSRLVTILVLNSCITFFVY